MKFIFWLTLGLFLGPTVLGLGWPTSLNWLPAVAGGFYLFCSGWELRILNLAQNRMRYLILFTGCFIFPFIVGYFSFAQNLFLAAAISISALPVAIQILKEKNRYQTSFGRSAVTVAALCDIAAFLLMATCFPANRLSSWVTGHWPVLAFFVGLAFGRFVPWSRHASRIQTWILAPIFFTALGWKVDLLSYFDLALTAKIFAIAVFAKVVGTYVSARLAGEKSADAKDLAAILNARGAMEILAAHFAFAAGLIEGSMFSALIVLGIGTSVIAVITVQRDANAKV